jgi:hypothetical protein
MSRCRRRGWCGRMASTIMPTLRHWPTAAPPSGNRLWSPHQPWTGRPCVRSVGRAIPSGVLPAGSCSCARVSSRVAVRPRLYGLGSARHEADPRQAAGGDRPGVWSVWRWPRGVLARAGTRSGGLSGPGLHMAALQGRLAGPVAGGRAWGCRGPNSIARRRTPVRPHPYALSPTKCYRECSGPDVCPPRGALP